MARGPIHSVAGLGASKCPSATPGSHFPILYHHRKAAPPPQKLRQGPARYSVQPRLGRESSRHQPQGPGWRKLLADSSWTKALLSGTGGQWRGRGRWLSIPPKWHGLRIWDKCFPPRPTTALPVEERGKRAEPSKPHLSESRMKDTHGQASGTTHLPQPPASVPNREPPPRSARGQGEGSASPHLTLFITCLEKSTCEGRVEFSILHAHVCH